MITIHVKTTVIATMLLASAIWCIGVTGATEEEDIQAIQLAILEQYADWRPGQTSVSNTTIDEKMDLAMSGEIPTTTATVIKKPQIQAMSMPERFDWRDTGKVTPVRNQRSCGACWAFSAIGTVESAFLVYGNQATDLSEQHIVGACCDVGDCTGGWPDQVLDYVKEVGVPTEACYPYTATDGVCNPCGNWQDTAYKIEDYVAVNNSTEDFKYALMKHGPISVVLTVPHDWYYYRSGVYSPVVNLADGVGWANHAVLLVGWDDSDACWIIKNSWGERWGERGYARVKYGVLEQYTYAFAITGVVGHGATPPQHPGWTDPIGAVSSTEYKTAYNATSAIDNNTATFWFSERRDPTPTITFDLGEITTITCARVNLFRNDVPMTINIETSSIDEGYDMVAEGVVIRDHSRYVEIPFAEVDARYVRVTQVKTRRLLGTCTDFQVYKTSDAEPEKPFLLCVEYPDRNETMLLDQFVKSLTVTQNGTHVFTWWPSGSHEKVLLMVGSQ